MGCISRDPVVRSGPVLGCCGDRTAQRPRPWSGPGLGAVLVRPRPMDVVAVVKSEFEDKPVKHILAIRGGARC
jgi:hypothetical protein